jgi:SNF2 family DNA or RNA helicase
MDELRAAMGHYSSVVLREEIDDMPPLIRTERPVVMSDLQRRAYLEMVSRFLVETDQGRVAAPDAGPRMQKLQQIVNGYLYDHGKVIEIDPDAPVYDALIEQVGGTLPGKSLVWCRFREDIRRCVTKLKEAGYEVLEYHGGVPLDQREPTRLDFQNNPKKFVLVGQPGAGGEGRDFSAADAVIFFSSTPNAIHYAQAEERATAVAGKSVAIVRITTPGTVDDRNWEIVDGKVTLADAVSGRGLRDLLLQTDI